ncbi:MAG: hypothetical protein H6925_01540 [Holosporaceae bacterium]|nr:MAG: hypothetical protein H6925_01540 [Holosporaceae bacterium]
MAAANRSSFPFEKLQFNKEQHNFMYKILLETPTHFKLKEEFCDLKGANSIVVGNPKLDAYRSSENHDPWKNFKTRDHLKKLFGHHTLLLGGL